jgi:hypothetical protein
LKRKKELQNLLNKAHSQAVRAEQDRHATAMIDIAERFASLLDAVDFDNLSSCPECGAMMKLDEGAIFFRWLCENNPEHSGTVRL